MAALCCPSDVFNNRNRRQKCRHRQNSIMRHIGHLPDQQQGRGFGDFLVAKGIHNESEAEPAGSSLVGIVEDDQIAEAQAWLGKFGANPGGAEFREAATLAAKTRKTEAEELAKYQRRVRSGKSLFQKFGGYGAGILTYALIGICVVVAFYTRLVDNRELLGKLFISNPQQPDAGFLPEVFQHGEFWRLFTPMFIHLSVPHFVFNMLWLFNLGCMIEARQSWRVLALVVVVTELCSSTAQYVISGPAFGGMSGVVYGLVGYVWMRGKYDRASGVFLDQ